MTILYSKYKKYIPLAILICFIALLLIPSSKNFQGFSETNNQASNGLVAIVLSTDKATLNQTITATVVLNTMGQAINTSGVVVNFDPNILSISSVDTSSSYCTFYADRAYNTNKGNINLYCGKPNPGFNGENILETITFKAIGFGKSPITINPKSLVLLNDGKATNILKNFEKKEISVILSQ